MCQVYYIYHSSNAKESEFLYFYIQLILCFVLLCSGSLLMSSSQQLTICFLLHLHQVGAAMVRVSPKLGIQFHAHMLDISGERKTFL